MGIPHFFTRISAYGTDALIGVRSNNTATPDKDQHQDRKSQSKLAIVDGPSLAHFLFDELTKGDHANDRAGCFYRYATIGEQAILWLDNLASFGWEMYAEVVIPTYVAQSADSIPEKASISMALCQCASGKPGWIGCRSMPSI